MKILYLGDICGTDVLDALNTELPKIRKEENINIVLANAENVSDGAGLKRNDYKKLMSLGISGLSMGNHTFSKHEITEFLNDSNIVIPANIPSDEYKKILYIKYNSVNIALVNMMGRVYNNSPLDSPFKVMDELLNKIKADYIIVDFHGDATSEKKAFFYDFAGKVSAVLGTHTHIQTNDEEVYNNTAYITDLGMCGPKDSILGSDKFQIIERFRTGIYQKANVAKTNKYIISGAIIDLDKEIKIKKFNKIIKR